MFNSYQYSGASPWELDQRTLSGDWSANGTPSERAARRYTLTRAIADRTSTGTRRTRWQRIVRRRPHAAVAKTA